MHESGKNLVDGLLLAALFILAPFAWILRDGLGPDSVPSTGWAAFGRWFSTFGTGYVLVGLLLAAIAFRWLGKNRPSPDRTR